MCSDVIYTWASAECCAYIFLDTLPSRFEATDNEHAAITGKNFPYILFYPAKEGAEGIKFEGEPSLKVNSHCSQDLQTILMLL